MSVAGDAMTISKPLLLILRKSSTNPRDTFRAHLLKETHPDVTVGSTPEVLSFTFSHPGKKGPLTISFLFLC